jgi:thiosulfate reductase / polysulfide reductase chain A
MEKKPFKISRRTFLKGTALTVGSLSLGSMGSFDFKTWARTSADAPVTRIPTTCNGCGNRCAIFAYVKNGRIWKVEGNPDANGNQGLLCPRGHGHIHDLYNPIRIRTPLKRVNGKFEPISWDQAYKEIARKINLILLENGPEAIFFYRKT